MGERVCEEPPWLVSVERVDGKRGTDRVGENFSWWVNMCGGGIK